MVELKKYQQKAIDSFKSYLAELEKSGAKRAFIYETGRAYQEEYFGSETPFMCMKLPTGGGKTLVGCHSVAEIMSQALKHKLDRGIVMWFVPSDPIKTQTLRKFKDRNDMHRQVFDEAFGNNVRVFSNEEALRIRKEDVENNLCIIISSLDAFRKDKKLQSKYKVYQENGSLLNHFENIEESKILEKDENDTIINSLANVIRLNNPLVIIDEGHKTKTQLSIDFLNELNPSFVLEYTATPRPESNVLVEIHSSELKEEEMVKLPIVLESSAQWQNAITRGVNHRIDLEKEAKKNKTEYIRPIALLQAQSDRKDSKDVTVQKVKEFLIKERKVPEEEIAVVYKDENEIDGLNLFSKKCKIRYIITVNKLAEGWDCSFASILISVANIGSKIAVEQIIGRILRMPNAKKKKNEMLNRSYIFASAKNFNEAANQIISGLEVNGYSKSDLINASSKTQKYELDVERAYKEDLIVPVVSYEGDYLAFQDLIGEDFELSKENPAFDFQVHYDSDGRAIIDIQEGDKWTRSAQQILNLTYKDKNFSKEELVQWLDKKLRFIELDKEDKINFLEKAIGHQLKKNSLSELSINRYVLQQRISEIIKERIENYTKLKFDELIDKKKIKVEGIKPFPEKITLSQEPDRDWNKNYYEGVDKLNKEEMSFVQRLDLDGLKNIKFWARSREKKDPFYIQGWKKNKFYPDFVAVTNKGSIIALEWKGEDRVSNEDTEYKIQIGQIWEKLGKNLHFFLVHNGNVEDVLNDLKNID